jgi:hypothetical protein
MATFLPGLFPDSMRMHRRARPAVYFEASVVIVALVFVGQVLELRARERTGDAIKALLDLAPKTARRITPDGDEYDAPLGKHRRGRPSCACGPGERVPVDACGPGRAFGGRREHGDRRGAARWRRAEGDPMSPAARSTGTVHAGHARP